MNQALAVAAVFGWFFVLGVLRVTTARKAVRADRGEFFELMRDIQWTIERGQPWTRLGWLTLAWGFLAPPVAVGVLILVAFLRR